MNKTEKNLLIEITKCQTLASWYKKQATYYKNKAKDCLINAKYLQEEADRLQKENAQNLYKKTFLTKTGKKS